MCVDSDSAPRVHGILISANVICGIIDTKNLCCIDSVINDPNCFSVVISEVVVFIVLVEIQETCQQVIFEFHRKALVMANEGMNRCRSVPYLCCRIMGVLVHEGKNVARMILGVGDVVMHFRASRRQWIGV